MKAAAARAGEAVVLTADEFAGLLGALKSDGYQLIGPTVRDEAIVYGEIDGVGQMPVGLTEVQEAGTYRLRRRNDQALFGYAVGPDSWKRLLHLPTLRLWSARRDENRQLVVNEERDDPPKMAFIGVRSCEIHAIAIQDKVLMGGAYVDPHYAARRRNIFIVAVNCTVAGGTCFCVSMRTGPRVSEGFDLALTELISGDRHEFLIEVGSDAGADLVSKVNHQAADDVHRDAAAAAIQRTEEQMGRSLDTTAIKELLYANQEHPRWAEVASRCLGCGNCTAVCPTCFCTTIEDRVDLAGQNAEHIRRWDSCFTLDFSYLHGGSVRTSLKSRYRQWMTHKLASWIDQFGTSGCVGCGRCVTWCPVGIDLTEEAAAIRGSQARLAREPADELE